MEKTIHSITHPQPLRFISGEGTKDASVFNDVVEVRKLTWDVGTGNAFSFDKYSEQYCVYAEEMPVASLTVTRLSQGLIDCMDHYPPLILNAYRSLLCSACRLRILPEYRWNGKNCSLPRIAHQLVRAAWRDQLMRGSRIDLINTPKRAVAYYKRLGYIHCTGWGFNHPSVNEPVETLFLAADPNHKSIAKDLFENIRDPLSIDEVLFTLSRGRTTEFEKKHELN